MVLHVTTDELLGMKPEETDERKRYFDAEYVEFWKKDDHEADYAIAKQAVEEYPGDYRYRRWLGNIEYYISFSRPEQKDFIDMMDSSIRHNLMVYENSPDEELRYSALWTIICAYRYSGRIEEARKYAEIYPEGRATSRDDAMEMCLEGEELLTHQQQMISDALAGLCRRLGNIWTFGDPADPRVKTAVLAEKTILETVIPDGNNLGFSVYLRSIHQKLAEIALAEGDCDTAVQELEIAGKYAAASHKARISGSQFYTAPLLDHIHYDYTDCRPLTPDTELLAEELEERSRYAPLRDRADFQSLLRSLKTGSDTAE